MKREGGRMRQITRIFTLPYVQTGPKPRRRRRQLRKGL
ncbi:hypothetical protein EcoM_02959 [Escherichia coli WV_060327]|nr:hypothetical protein EcoM_02959 [Escherichia coli WV_060327]